MGIFTKLLGGGLVLSLLFSGGLYLKSRWDSAKIEKLQIEVANHQAAIGLIKQSLEATEKYKESVKKERTRYVKEDTEIKGVVESGDDAGMRLLFERSGLLKPPSGGASPGR